MLLFNNFSLFSTIEEVLSVLVKKNLTRSLSPASLEVNLVPLKKMQMIKNLENVHNFFNCNFFQFIEKMCVKT